MVEYVVKIKGRGATGTEWCRCSDQIRLAAMAPGRGMLAVESEDRQYEPGQLWQPIPWLRSPRRQLNAIYMAKTIMVARACLFKLSPTAALGTLSLESILRFATSASRISVQLILSWHLLIQSLTFTFHIFILKRCLVQQNWAWSFRIHQT